MFARLALFAALAVPFARPLHGQDPAPARSPAGSATVSDTLPAGLTAAGADSARVAAFFASNRHVEIVVPPEYARQAGTRYGAAVLVGVSGAADRDWRLRQLTGYEPAVGGYLLRSPSSATPRSRDGIRVLVPEVETVWNTRIPFSVNDGPLWAGRGASGRVMAGFIAAMGPVRLIAAPEMVWSENAQFDSVLPTRWTAEQRARFVAPWFAGRNSADVPWRPGDDEVQRLYPGQSSLTVTAGAVEAGAATENQWWGPGIRSGILFSNNAAGFPHLFVRSGRPLRTFLGDVEGRWLVGGLEASDYAPARNGEDDGVRSLSALGLTLRPAAFPALTLGIARTVMSPVDEWGGVAGRFADVLGHWDAGRDTLGRAAEQMIALSARVVAPGDGAEAYFEWARREMPTSFRDLLLRPEHTQGYTIGGQVARPLGSGHVRLQAEHTYLEQSPTETRDPAGSFYASERIPQGYTNNGEVLGASMGPGSSGQWLAADWVTARVEAGVFGGRIRWANDAYFDQPGGPNRYLAHDMTAYFGARLGVDLLGARLSAEWTANKRWNYLFQSTSGTWQDRDRLSVDVMNRTLRLGLSASPRLGRRIR